MSFNSPPATDRESRMYDYPDEEDDSANYYNIESKQCQSVIANKKNLCYMNIQNFESGEKQQAEVTQPVQEGQRTLSINTQTMSA